MEKLLIFYILTRQINLEEINLSHVSNPLSFKILKVILRLAKREEDMPTFDGLKMLFKDAISGHLYRNKKLIINKKIMTTTVKMKDIVNLCQNRGFVYP